MRTTEGGEQSSLRSLRRSWVVYLIASSLFLLGLFLLLRRDWGAAYAVRWLLAAGALTVYHWVFLWRHLDENRLREPGEPLLPGFGLANWMTMTRATFTAALGGFLFGPWPQGWLAWAPSALYLTSSVIDYFDGFAARVTGQTTRLGERLDMMWDGAAMLFAATLTVRYGQSAVPFLLVGLARYLYLFGIWLWNRRGLPVYDLLPNRFRRPFAGMMMGFVAVILMPVYGPPATRVAAALFMLPFLSAFLWDWLTVSGQIARRIPGQLEPGRHSLREIIPLAARVLLVSLLIELVVYLLRQQALPVGLVIVAGVSALAVLLGAAGRLFALAALLMTGFGLQMAPLEARFWIILLISTISMMVGTGRFSLWKPEDQLLYTLAGQRRPRGGGAR